jgi:hypothetical protein
MSTRLSICLTGIFLFLQIYLSAQDKSENYIKGEIPEFLKKDADAVCRLDEQVVEIVSPGKITVRERHIYTILNSNAEHFSNYYTDYNKLKTVNSVNAKLYNAAGKEIQHVKKKDMSDFPRNDEAFVSDDRVKICRFSCNSFPYSVDFEEEDEISGALYIPNWEPPRSDKMSVEVSRYIMIVPAEYKFRYKMVNSDIKPVVTEKGGELTYIWEIRNMPVMPDEPLAISSELFNPQMLVGPTDFDLQGYRGNMSDWKEYGKFYSSLQKGRDNLPDDVRSQVHILTDQLNRTSEKVEVLYDYLQKNTHYVLIQFGIGGLQPYEASYVAKNKYGDCKALTNFMVALLKEAGIKGHPVIIRGDEDNRVFFPDFPSHQFNHVICAVPNGKDTIWLECTDQYLPAGYLGSFTADRYGLFVDDDGGTLVHTPAYLLKDNTSKSRLEAVLDPEGNLQIKSETRFQALSYDPSEKLVHHYSKDEQLEHLKKEFELPTYTVNSFQYSEENRSKLPVMRESINITVSGYAHVTGKRIFINPNLLHRSELKIPDVKMRELDFQFDEAYSETDSIQISIPNGYETESEPADLSIETKYGRFRTHLVIKEGKVQYFRYLEQFSGRFPAKEYEFIKYYFDQIYNSDHSQIVLVRKANG